MIAFMVCYWPFQWPVAILIGCLCQWGTFFLRTNLQNTDELSTIRLHSFWAITTRFSVSLCGEFLSAIQVQFVLIRQPRWPSFSHIYKCTLLNKDSCCVTVLSCSVVTGKACTCLMMKAESTEVASFVEATMQERPLAFACSLVGFHSIS